MKKNSQKVFKYLLSIPLSDKEIIGFIEDLIEYREQLKTAKTTKFPFKKIEIYKWRVYFLIIRASSLGIKLSTNEVMRLLKIPPGHRRIIDDFLCEHRLLLREKEEKPKDIKLEIAPIGKSIIEQAKRGRPAYIYGVDTEAVREVQKTLDKLDKDMVIEILDMIGINKPLKKLLKQAIGNDKDEFVKFIKENFDVSDVQIPPKSR